MLPDRRRPSRLALAIVSILLALAAAWLAWPPAAPSFAEVRAAWRPSDAWLLDRHGVVIDQRRVDFEARRLQWVRLDDISPALVAAVVAGEDRRFWQHAGVDWRGVAAALRDTWLRDRRRGASTITMQLAELLPAELAPAATGPAWWRKIRQMRTARGLEARWTKPQILEAYLNLLGFRGELAGIGAAALELAGKTPAGLDGAESLVLAALLMASSAHAQASEALGEVGKVDVAAAKVTLKHGEIKNLDMPPMTMTYRVKDKALLNGVNTGDKVWFTAEKIDGQYVVTTLKPAGK